MIPSRSVSLMHGTSITLLERLRTSSDAEAWGRFVRIYTPFLFHWADRHGLQPSDAADLVQEVFAQLLKILPAFAYDPQRSFRSWLFAIVGNKWRELQRKRHALPVPHDSPPLATLVSTNDASDFDETEYRSYVSGRALALIRQEFAPATWRAFWHVVVDGQPAEVVATELGLTRNAVYLARGRVLRRLRIELAGLVD